MDQINWKASVNWDVAVVQVIDYFAKRPDLKFGPSKANKALPVIGDICRRKGPVTRYELIKSRELEALDDIATILSNVTMALQGSGNGDVLAPELGGWYVQLGSESERAYVVCPGFAQSWRKFWLA